MRSPGARPTTPDARWRAARFRSLEPHGSVCWANRESWSEGETGAGSSKAVSFETPARLVELPLWFRVANSQEVVAATVVEERLARYRRHTGALQQVAGLLSAVVSGHRGGIGQNVICPLRHVRRETR